MDYLLRGTVDEDFEQIGELLRKAREARELSVDDVVHKAHLPRSVVEALEAENFSAFTSPTYAKSFLAQYGEFLNVDAKPWLDALEPAAFLSGDLMRPLIATTGGQNHEAPPEQESRSGALSALWILGVSAGLVYAAIWGYQQLEDRLGTESQPLRQRPPEPVPPKPAPPQIAKPAGPEPPKDSAAGVPEIPKPTPRAIIVRD